MNEDYTWIQEVWTIRDMDKVMDQSLTELEHAMNSLFNTIEGLIKDAPTMSIDDLDEEVE